MGPTAHVHPLLRYGPGLLALLLAAATTVVSASVNIHSLAWLAAFYTAFFFFLLSIRTQNATEFRRPYATYMVMLCLYLFVVWVLHIMVPVQSKELVVSRILFWTKFTAFGGISMAPALFHFTRAFTRSSSKVLKGLDIAGWVGALVFYGYDLRDEFFIDYHWSGQCWFPQVGMVYFFFFWFTSFYVTLSMAVPFFAMLKARDRQRRLQLQYYLVGAAPMWISCWINFLISIGFKLYPAGGLSFLFHASVLAYAVFRHRVFDFTVVVRRALPYAAVSLLVGLVYGLLVMLLSRLIPDPAYLGIPVVVVTSFLLVPLLEYAQGAVDRLFFRREADRRKRLDQLTREAALTIQLDEVARLVVSMLHETTGARSVTLYLASGEQRMSRFSTKDDDYRAYAWPDSEAMEPEHLRLSEAPGVARFRPHEVRATVAETVRFEESNEHLLVPIWHRNEKTGCLVIGPRKSGEAYDDPDLDFVLTVSAQSSIALRNARAYATIRQLENMTRRTLESLHAGVLLIANDGTVALTNPAIAKIVFPSDVQASRLAQVSDMDMAAPELAAWIRATIETGRDVENVDLTLERDEKRFLLASLGKIDQEGTRSLYLVLIHDLTEYKSMEAIVRRKEGLAQVGEMITTINHEIKNVLQPIRYQFHRLNQWPLEEVNFKNGIGIISSRFQSLDRLLANLRDLAKPLELHPRSFDVRKLVQSVWVDIQALPKASGVELQVGISDDQSMCKADPQLLRQVLYNLLHNAVDAMSGREARKISIVSANGGHQFYLRVKDNGCGIAPQAVRRLFEPFYSTKPGTGTGLGLCICRKIVEAHGGSLTVASEPEQGTEFSIALPSAASSLTLTT